VRSLIICTPGDKLEGDRAVNVTHVGGGGVCAFRDGNSEVSIKDIGWEDLDSVHFVRCMNKQVAGCCEHCDQQEGFIKRRELLEE